MTRIRKIHRFNNDRLNPLIPKKVAIQKTSKNSTKIRNIAKYNKKPKPKNDSLVVGEGHPWASIFKPVNGQVYINKDTADAFIFAKKLGWINLSGWQPDVGEGPPDVDNPPDPISGDQYLNIFNGDLYVFTEGMGWILQNAIEGPKGEKGDSFSFELETCLGGPDGPVLSGPIKVEPGRKVRLWMEKRPIYAELV